MSIQGLVGLDVEFEVIYEDTAEVWIAGDRSICIQGLNPTLLQLETKPSSQGNGCLQPILHGVSYANPYGQ